MLLNKPANKNSGISVAESKGYVVLVIPAWANFIGIIFSDDGSMFNYAFSDNAELLEDNNE